MKTIQTHTAKQYAEAIRLAILDSQGNLDILDERIKPITANGLPEDAIAWQDLFRAALQGLDENLAAWVAKDYLSVDENECIDSDSSSASTSPTSGKLLNGRYQIIQELGRGGFSQTYIAQDISLAEQPKCVIKHLKPLLARDLNSLETARQLFNCEAEVLQTLSHPQIPQLLAHFEQDQAFYLVQECIEGQPLSSELLPGQGWTEAQVIELLLEILSVLEFLHNQKIIHRDIKPDNLIRRQPDQKLVVIDFGSAKHIQLPQTAEAVAMVSEGYSPIEQRQGKPSLSSDLYALGKIGIQALTGIHPNQLEADPDTGEIPWPPQVQVSDGLVAVLAKMVRDHAAERYQTAEAVTQALQQLGTPQPPERSPVSSRPYVPTKVVPLAQSPESLTALSQPKRTFKPEWPSPSQARLEEQDPFSDFSFTPLPTDERAGRLPLRQMLDKSIAALTPKRVALLTGAGLITAGITTAFILMIGLPQKFRLRSANPPLSPISRQASPTEKFLANTLTGQSTLIRSVAFSPDGQTLISGSEDSTLKVWDLKTGSQVQTLTDHSGWISSVAIAPDGQTLASGSKDSTINLWNLRTGALLRTLRGHLWPVLAIAISPDGQTLVSGSEDNTIKLWNLKTGQLLKTLAGYTAPFSAVEISSDGWLLAAGSADNTIRIWELHTGRLLHVLRGHSGSVNSVAISSNSALLASSSADKTVKIWNLYAGQLLHTLEGHADEVHTVAFSPDGQILVSGSEDRKIIFWNPQTGKRLQTFDGHSGPVHSVTFSPDGQTIASGSWDKTIKLWKAP